ncbi:hypothetical protein GW916_03705 [bacterium]|nr:hypothetical protein [bacterium]
MSDSDSGYYKKPFWIYFVSALFLTTPVLHLMWTLRMAGEANWYSPLTMIEWLPHLNPAPAVISALLFIAGFSILFVRKWAWWMGILSLAALCFYNISIVRNFYSDDWMVMTLSTVGSGLLLLLLYVSDFKQPFFNQRLRWWETDPRYMVNVPVKLQGHSHAVVLMDVSKSGILLQPLDNIEIEFPSEAIVEINSELHLPCIFSRKTEAGAAYRIISISRHQSRYLRNWLDLLAKEPERKVRD